GRSGTQPARTPNATPRSSAICSSAESTSRRHNSRPCSSRWPTATRRSRGRCRPLPISTADLWETIAVEAGQESPLWRDAVRADDEPEPVFSPLGEERNALGLETIYEGYLVHYGRPRLFEPADEDTALLLGDYLYAHGLVRIADVGTVDAVADLAELISLCAQLRADSAPGDGVAWAASAALLGAGELDEARRALRDRGNAAPLEALAASRASEALELALA